MKPFKTSRVAAMKYKVGGQCEASTLGFRGEGRMRLKRRIKPNVITKLNGYSKTLLHIAQQKA